MDGSGVPVRSRKLRMSALPVLEPYVEPAVVTRPRPRPRTPETVVIELPRHRVKRKQATKAGTKGLVTNAIGFVALASVTFCSVSLAGQVLVEKARRDSISASGRARAATREIATLRQRVQDLTSSRSIEEWALANAFAPTEDTPQSQGVNQLVALNR